MDHPITPASSQNTDIGKTLGGVGIWAFELRFGDPAEIVEAASELDECGFSAIWVPDAGGDVLAALDRLLAGTVKATIATGILNIWMHDPSEVARWWAGLSPDRRYRVLLGLGVSHSSIIGDRYSKPLEVMASYLDGLDDHGLPATSRCLAALGPKMLGIARDRSAGAHPYLVTPEFTSDARAALGPAALLAVEQGVILETEAHRARGLARRTLALYQRQPNYVNNWLRLGFTEEDIADLSDRLCDALFAWGSVETVKSRVDAHRDAGAGHVCLQVVTDSDNIRRGARSAGAPMRMPRQEWRELAAALV